MEKQAITRREGGTQLASESIEQREAAPPATDIYENAEELLLVADIPGVGNDAVTIHCEKDRLSVCAKRSQILPGGTIAAEYRPVDFRRDFLLPRGIDVEKIDAKVEAGVLTVRLPKSGALKPRQIPVKAV